MISKKIHYCWFGRGKKDDKTNLCISSWRKKLTDYEIIEWNEDNFDVNSVPFVSEAYSAKKWAFVADYVRLWALKEYGGIYLDADVEVIKPFDDLLDNNAFTCFESTLYDGVPQIEAAVIGSEKGGRWITEMLNIFENAHFKFNRDGKTEYDLEILPSKLIRKTLEVFNIKPQGNDKVCKCDDLIIFDYHWFSPKMPKTDVIEQNENTYAIHHFNNSWVSPYAYHKLRWKYYRKFGKRFGIIVFVLVHPIKAIRVYRYGKYGKEPIKKAK